MRYTYSRWTGSAGGLVDPEAVIEALSDDLMADGDLANAFQRLSRWGLPDADNPVPGVQALQQQLRALKQHELERYRLDSSLDALREQLGDVVRRERETVERRRTEAGSAEGPEGRALQAVADRKLAALDALPNDLGGAANSLSQYEFLDGGARDAFDDLMQSVRDRILRQHTAQVESALHRVTSEQIDDLRELLRDLTALANGGAWEPFRENHGHQFPEAASPDDLWQDLSRAAAGMESLMAGLTPESRRELEGLIDSALADVSEEIAELSRALRTIAPFREHGPAFSGEQSLTLDEALRLMGRMHDLEDLEASMKRALDTGNLEHVDSRQVQDVMGEAASSAVRQLQQVAQALEEAGYIERRDGQLELTARGIRRIGQKALEDIFSRLKGDAFGEHGTTRSGVGGDRTDDSKAYEWGDPFLLDMQRTLMNAMERGGEGAPISLEVADFEVFRTEYLTQAATVLMLDMSRSMPLRGCFVAAKKVALALSSLIRSQYPRDRLYIVGFSDYARELHPEQLHRITWGDYVYGTNMQHGFQLARRLLGRHKSGNRQIILITDGEPTAHVEGDRVHFAYPPTFRTFQETLREVQRCTKEGIVINTFMLERSHYLADFVNQMTRINHGRAFFATPDRLGDYILVDYVRRRGHAG